MNPPKSKALTPAQQTVNTFQALLDRSKGEIARAVPKHVDPDRLARVSLTLVRTTPGLLECDPKSILGGVMMSAQLGLELGMIGHAYLVPFNNKKTGRKEAQFIIGYRGMIDLARRSGHIKSIKAEVVWEGDLFELEYGLEDRLHHVPYHCRKDGHFEKGKVRGAYAVAHFTEGGHALLYMPKVEIDEHRERSRASSSGPWVTDYPEMAKKTVVRGIFKWLPISIEVARAVEANDETAKTQIMDDMALVQDSEQADPWAGAEDAKVVEEAPVTAPVKVEVAASAPKRAEKKGEEERAPLTDAQKTINGLPQELFLRAWNRSGCKHALREMTDEECSRLMDHAIAIEEEDREEGINPPPPEPEKKGRKF